VVHFGRMNICANERCAGGEGGKPKRFTPLKPWRKYCSKACGDAARHRAYYQRKAQSKAKH